MPNNWKTYKLGEIAKLRKKNITPKDFDNQHYIGLEHIGQGTFLLDGIGTASDATSNKSVFKSGDILYGKIRPYFKKVYKPKFSGICSTDILVINSRNEELITQSYLHQLIKSQDFTDKATETSSGTKMPRADWNSLEKLEYNLPPLQEQKSIASILSAIDDKIENNLAINKTLEEMAMVLYKHWFVDFGPFQDGEFVESELGMIPKGWEVKRIEEILDIKPLNGLYKKSEYQGFGNRWLKMTSVYGLDIINNQKMDLISVTENEIEKYGCLKDDIVFGRTSLVLEGIGKCAIIKCKDDIPIFESNLFRIRLDKTKVYPDLIYLFFKSVNGRNEVKKLARQTAAVSITSKDLIGIKIALPNINIQKDIGDKIDFFMKKQIENIIENQTLTQLRDTLLPKLISGEVRLKEFVSSDK
jgi:type I restriction enzyme S subunit